MPRPGPKRARCVRALSALLIALAAPSAGAGEILDAWKDGLRGARLTAFSGSVMRSNSSLTVLTLCRSGRFRLETDASWSAPGGAAMGASVGVVTGTWNVESRAGAIFVTYRTDAGESGAYPTYLQPNGRVNIGGTAYAAERGAAGC